MLPLKKKNSNSSLLHRVVQNWSLGLMGPSPPWLCLICWANFIARNQRCPKRGMPTGSSIFFHQLRMDYNLCEVPSSNWPCVKFYLVVSYIYLPFDLKGKKGLFVVAVSFSKRDKGWFYNPQGLRCPTEFKQFLKLFIRATCIVPVKSVIRL